jgi:acyl homoserine lactone synthase
MFRLRHKLFVQRQKYRVPTLNGMEWDQFDTPATVYLVWRDETDTPRAVARMIPTTFPYMIQELWPDMVGGGELPSRPDVWELSRVGIDRDLPPEVRRRVTGELMCACGEFALHNGVAAFLLVTHPHFVSAAIAGAGWPTEVLGEPRHLGRFPVVAAKTTVSDQALRAARQSHGVLHPVLRVVGSGLAQAA